MAIQVVEVTPALANQYRNAIKDFARTLAVNWRCAISSPDAYDPAYDTKTWPDVNTLSRYITVDEFLCLAVVDTVGPTILGYACFKPTEPGDQDGTGGVVKWLGFADVGTPAQKLNQVRNVMDQAALKYGWLWGRIRNPTIRTVLLADANCTQDPDDEQVLFYKRVV